MKPMVLTRRRLLQLCAAAGSVSCFGGTAEMSQLRRAAIRAIDHLLLGCADLDRGVEWVERSTGVRAVTGGSHPGVGTHNALLSLGDGRYLEIIAPDPAQNTYRFHIDVRSLSEPRLITWAAVTEDIEGLVRLARAQGYTLFGPQEGSREKPDGQRLRWKIIGVSNSLGLDEVEPVPFFIEWASDSKHPSLDSTQGCELTAFEMEHPESETLRSTLQELGIEAMVGNGPTARLTATLNSPKGLVSFS